MIESDVEKYFRKRVEKVGGLCLKWISPGNRGVPDRIVFYQGNIWLVEMKQPEGKLRSSQKVMHKRLLKAGIIVYVLYNIDDVDDFVERMMNHDEKVYTT